MKAYSTFYERYRDKIFLFLFRRSGDRQLSEDLTQESFVRHMKRYRDADPSPYLLYAIARNALVDFQRRKKAYVPIDEEETASRAGNAEDFLLARERKDSMEKALGSLSVRERKLLSLAASGMRYSQIAAVLDLSEGNVKVLVHRARVKLRQLLEQGE